MNRHVLLLCFAALAGGCATPPSEPPAMTELERELLRAVSDARASLQVLSQVRATEARQNLSYGEKRELIYAAAHIPAGMESDLILQHGVTAPLDTVLQLVAEESGYAFERVGRPPVEDIIIDIPGGTFPVVTLLRDAAWQAANQGAQVQVIEDAQIIRLLYRG